MNTLDDLAREFERLEALAPDRREISAALPASLTAHRSRREKRRRTAALAAVAASVVLIAGGISVTAGLMKSRPGSAQPAAPSPVVAVPDIPLPAGSTLIRHQLQAVTSPVTATPPAGLTGTAWIQSPGRLAVSYFDLSAATSTSGAQVVTGGASETKSAGYVVTDSAAEHLRTFGADGTSSVAATSRDILVAGHPARLDSAPNDAVDEMGFPAAQRVSWKLADGRYIHVWATGGSGDAGSGWTSYSPLGETTLSAPAPSNALSAPAPSDAAAPAATEPSALASFAASIVEKPAQLYRAVGIGLTLPGLTVDSSINVPVVGGFTPESLMMCPAGVDPFTVTGSTSSGSTGSSVAAESGAGQSMSIEPAVPETVADDPAGRCLGVAVMSGALSSTASVSTHPVTVGGTTVTIVSGAAGDPAYRGAIIDLGRGLTAAVSAPATAAISDADLARLAASVRLSPDVTVIPAATPGSDGAGAAMTDEGSAAAVASSSAATLPLPPGEASIAGEPGSVEGGDGSSSASVTVTSSAATPADPNDPSVRVPIEVLGAPDHEFYIGVDHDDRSGEVQVSIKNASDQAVTVEGIDVGAATVNGTTVRSPGVTLTNVRMRLDNTAADADQPFQGGMLPVKMAPGTVVRLQLEFAVGQCSSLVASQLPVGLTYQTAFGVSGAVNVAASWGVDDWVGTFSKYFCS